MALPAVLPGMLLVLWGCGASGPPSHGPPGPQWLELESTMGSQASVAWSPVPGAQGYRLYRRQEGGFWFTVVNLPPRTFYQDRKLQPGKRYLYRVSALVGGAETQGSPQQEVLTVPALVGGLKARRQQDAIRLAWKPAPGASGYRIYRETLGGKDAPQRWSVDGAEATQFADQGAEPGTDYFYEVVPFNASGEALGDGVTAAVPAAAGAPESPGAPAPQAVTSTLAAPSRLELVPGGSGVDLRWHPAGSSFRILRGSTPGALRVIRQGVAGPAYRDVTLPRGERVYYQVADEASGLTSAVQAVTLPVQTPRPWSGVVEFGLGSEPLQRARVWVPDQDGSIPGLMLLHGVKAESVPNLTAAAAAFNLAWAEVGAFNFGTPEAPEGLSAADDPGHELALVDFHWPGRSALRVQALLEALAATLPGHPELSGAPLVWVGFSQATVHNAQAAVRAPLAGRSLAAVLVHEINEDRWMPEDFVGEVPHLFVAAGGTDPYSRLNHGMEAYPSVTFDRFARGRAGHRGAPLTVVNHTKAGHGQLPLPGFAGLWLSDVLAQRLGQEDLDSWRGRGQWSGTYDLEESTQEPWGDAGSPGVRLVGVSVDSPGRPGPRVWLPSRETAEAWKAYSETGTEDQGAPDGP